MTGQTRTGRFRSYFLLAAYGFMAVGLGLFLGWLAVRHVEWGAMADLLSHINPLAMIAAFTAVLIAAYLRGVRWRILLRDEPITAKRLFLIEQTGVALDTLSIVRLLGVLVQAGILTVRDRIAVGKVLATLAMQRTLEFGTVSLILFGGALLLGPIRPYWPYLSAGLGLTILAISALFIIGPALKRLWLISKLRLAHEFADAVVLLRAQPARALRAFGLSIVQSLLIGCAGWLLAFGLGLNISLPAAIVVTLAIMLFGSYVPGLPLAFGTFEFAAVTLLSVWGKSPTDAVSFAVGLRAVLFLPPLIVAAAFLPNEGLFSLPAVRRLLAEASSGR